MGFKVAVVGATGNVGREILTTLAERDFPADEVVALASSRSVGREVSFGEDDVLKVQDLETFDFQWHRYRAVLARRQGVGAFAPRATKAGAVVIDNTSQFRMEPDVPLVVPEVNPKAIGEYQKRGIIANPNCSTIQMVVALKPLHDLARIKRVVVATYQSISGAGRAAMDELFNQTRAIFVNDPVKPEQFTKQIAFNVIPHIDVFMDDGATKEEWKMAVETRKILDPDIAVTATCVRVPVFIGHGEAVNVEFERALSADMARAALRRAPGVSVVDHRADEGYVTPNEAAGEDLVYVSRIRTRPDRSVWSQLLGGRRQSAQRGRAQCGADRRNPGRRASRRQARPRPLECRAAAPQGRVTRRLQPVAAPRPDPHSRSVRGRQMTDLAGLASVAI